MDAAALRWTLAIIGIVLLVGIYLYGLHQSRLRKRAAMETFTREEIDSAFIEDEQLREELDNLNHILNETDSAESFNQITINPAMEADLVNLDRPTPDWYTADSVAEINDEFLVNYLLYHSDYRLITGDEIDTVIRHNGLTLNAAGFLQFIEDDQLQFTIASLSEPGHFSDYANAEFTTLGFNCYIDLSDCENGSLCNEAMLKKIDELVRLLNVKVYHKSHELLTISDVTEIRKNLNP